MPPDKPLVIKGWNIFAHPLFLEQMEALLKEVETERDRNPQAYKTKNSTKRLAAIAKLAFETIPEHPAAPAWRQGKTLGNDRKHWFRAKFFQQYRLFFRYHETSKIIVLAWVNDEKTKRAYGAKTDAYATFGKMLDKGNPPDSWHALLKATKN